MTARTHTPDRITVDTDGQKTTTFKLKRACNGCGQLLGDTDNRDVDPHGRLTDVRAECDHCRPLVELEAAGCKTWELTPRSFSRVMWEIDQTGIFTKPYTSYVTENDEGRLKIVGLRVGERPNHVVARFRDWIIRHPDGHFSTHTAPAEAAT